MTGPDARQVLSLQCPRCRASGLALPQTPGMVEPLPASGQALCRRCGARYAIHKHVLDLSQPGDDKLLTLAGLSNTLPVLPWIYEHVWRPRALTLLTCAPFPRAQEIALLDEWLALQPGELVIDLGSSTGNYARGIGRQSPSTILVAIDMAIGMLHSGWRYARQDGIKNIAHIRAPVQHLPFANAAVDALACGGSLNEFRSMREALDEARRVCKPNGRMFLMSLLRATRVPGRLGQYGARLSGIQFPTRDQLNGAAQASGWHIERQQQAGMVIFTLLRPQ